MIMEYKVAKYMLIKEDIIKDIKLGVLQPGDKVDSESILKKKYNVSTITVRKAFNDLINEGYLIGVQGTGTFVRKKQMIRGLTSISFSDELLQQGYQIDMLVDKIEEIINPSIADILEIPHDQSIVCVRRVRLANDEPIAYQSSFVDSRILSTEQANRIHENASFYKTLKEFKIFPTWVNENYSVKQVNDSRIAKMMNIKKNSDTFFVKRIAFDELDKVIEYAETNFNKDWYSVTVNIKV
ncbi:MAG: GntR family transcriptional regulator [Eubacteriales bacterium]